MTIVSADYLLTCDKEFKIVKNQAICFDSKIKEIAPLKDLTKRYPDAKVILCESNSVLMPGLINVHMHLEFSANKTTLDYGDFISWLNSVIKSRDDLSSRCDEAYIDGVLKDILKSGTTTIGAISSFGADLNSCVKTPINVVYFNEVLGSNPAAVDALYNDFLGRLEESKRYESDSFTPAISIHSPYSTHPILAKKALLQSLLVSTHFMESKAERDWLDCSSGDFVQFFKNFAPDAKPVNEAISYLELFKGYKTLFTHATLATEKELEMMNDIGTITHCPVSNRLLGSKKLDIKKVKNLTLATDGLSSNSSLNLWDEMRAALMIHESIDPNLLAKELILASTANASKALYKNSGMLEKGLDGDIISLKLPDVVENLDALALFLVLHIDKAEHIFIKGIKQQ